MADGKTDSSVDLLLKAQVGDDEALNQLLARYLPRLRRWARGKLPSDLRTMLDTGDLVQDAIVRALPHVNTLEVRSERAFEFYLQRAVKNHIIDLRKRANHRPLREELPENKAADLTAPDQAAMTAQALDRYRRALARLTKEDREAIVLRVEHGLDFKQIAKRLNKRSGDSARMTVRRAIVRLAERMARLPPRR
jgi:RNA polymerase sigma-70 factor (ECF subfamily)